MFKKLYQKICQQSSDDLYLSPELRLTRIENCDEPYYAIGGSGGDLLDDFCKVRIPYSNLKSIRLNVNFSAELQKTDEPYLFGKIGIDAFFKDESVTYTHLFNQKIKIPNSLEETKSQAAVLIKEVWESKFAEALGDLQDQDSLNKKNTFHNKNTITKKRWGLTNICTIVFFMLLFFFLFFKFYHKSTQPNEMSLENTTNAVFEQAVKQELEKNSTQSPGTNQENEEKAEEDVALADFGLQKGVELDQKTN